jgi:non-specific serine/threonine protein kinase
MATRMMPATLVFTPEGRLFLDCTPTASEHLPEKLFAKIAQFFDKDPYKGLLHLGIEELGAALPGSFSFWQRFARLFVTQLCKLPAGDSGTSMPSPDDKALSELLDSSLGLQGCEYLTIAKLQILWHELTKALQASLSQAKKTPQEYLQSYNARWNLVGRICLHLAENKNNSEKPFAFLATYTTHLSSQAVAQHLPLNRALQEYAGDNNREALLQLLQPVQKAAASSQTIKKLLDTGGLFHAQSWTPQEAHLFLKDIPQIEASGLNVRVPNWWSSSTPPRPRISVTVGQRQTAGLDIGALLDFNVALTLNGGEQLSSEEWRELFNGEGNLIKVKEQWVEINRDELQAVLQHWQRLQRASAEGLSIRDGLRLLASKGVSPLQNSDGDSLSEECAAWSTVAAGEWLAQTLEQLRNPSSDHSTELISYLQQHLVATLRPYQLAGVQWLWLLYKLRLGGCLADDMGLGKTIQLLALMLLTTQSPPAAEQRRPHLLVVPASLLGNWQNEAHRFAPTLRLKVLHSSSNGKSSAGPEDFAHADVVMTTYALLYRQSWLLEQEWDMVILDEAQQIKNHSSKQARAAKALKSKVSFALTGTPVENRLEDLWSLFDFTAPGLLGNHKTFAALLKKSAKDSSGATYSHFVSTLRSLTRPYILRRLKSDKSIISDLPEKVEMQTLCSLSKKQVSLYAETVQLLGEQLRQKERDDIQRRGIVLSFLLRLKQICNHPTQWLGYGEYPIEESGKFIRLQEICAEIAAKQEKVLIFTQFREIIPHLAALLAKTFGREGLQLHGETPVKQRQELVAAFQQELGPPFFVLSLKAGGTGLTLTRASHVIHFDRWWNPAVENQATDRAYRIGQQQPVMVHKFTCAGTIEEKIDALIAAKQALSNELLAGGKELMLTEMSNDELLDLVSLDLEGALEK